MAAKAWRRTIVVGAVLVLLAPGRGALAEETAPDSRLRAAQVTEAIATACNENRYSDVGEFLHPSLRRMWIDIGFQVKDFCERLTRDGTLAETRIDKEEQVGEHAVVYVTYVFQGGAQQVDRATFLRDKGVWKLAG